MFFVFGNKHWNTTEPIKVELKFWHPRCKCTKKSYLKKKQEHYCQIDEKKTSENELNSVICKIKKKVDK